MQKLPKLLIIIFVFALFLRFYRLETFPLGFHVDEAKVGWEAYSILKTLRDDHGNLLALYYNSFGDYRPTGIFYSTIPFIAILGKNNFSVRLSSALLGALTVFPVYLIAEKITKKKSVGLMAAFLLTIIPWHLETSRATSEVVISCFLVLTSLALLIKKPVFSLTFLAASFLTYHSARVLGPILMLIWILTFWKDIKLEARKTVVIGFTLTTFFSLLLILSPEGRGRYNQVKLSTPSIRNIITNYTTYFNPNFFIDDIAKPFRYTTGNVGIVSIPIFFLFLVGVYVIIKTSKNRTLLLSFMVGPIPAALTLEDSPNLHRAFFMLPFLVIISAIGLIFLLEKHKTFFKIIVFCIIWSFVSFVVNYMDTNNNFAFQYRNPQTKILSIYIMSIKNNYDRIYVTNDPDSPYPWYYFFQNYDPIVVNAALQKGFDGKWQYENIIWDNTRCPAGKAFDEAKKDRFIKKIMVVDNGMCFTDYKEKLYGAKIIKEFSYNSKVNYRIWEYEPIRF